MNIDLNESSQFYEHEAAKAGSLSLIILSEQEASYICFCKYLVNKFVGTKTLKKPSWEIVKAKLTSLSLHQPGTFQNMLSKQY